MQDARTAEQRERTRKEAAIRKGVQTKKRNQEIENLEKRKKARREEADRCKPADKPLPRRNSNDDEGLPDLGEELHKEPHKQLVLEEQLGKAQDYLLVKVPKQLRKEERSIHLLKR